ncbi:MAG TPA: polysaccharide deacetylase family protein [Kineosporiaceae bacterium]|nr:polysaccharide deacetylase family protein [Kineosporiaceae bacterium]
MPPQGPRRRAPGRVLGHHTRALILLLIGLPAAAGAGPAGVGTSSALFAGTGAAGASVAGLVSWEPPGPRPTPWWELPPAGIPGPGGPQVVLPPHPDPLPCPATTPGFLRTTPPTARRTVALTFDDGPGPWTPQFLEVLARYHVHGTFFMVGGRAAANPQLVAQVAGSGNLVGNHTWNHPLHPSLSTLPPDQVRREIGSAEQVLTRLSGSAPCFFRGPGEDHKPIWLQDIARSYGLTVTDTTRTAGDAGNPLNAAYDPAWRNLIVTRLTAAGDHPIVLMHDGHTDNKVNELSALEQIITWYQARGYVFTDPSGRPIG